MNEQRFAAYLLQGAIALGRSERTANEVRLNRLNEVASDRFQSALHVAGKANDLDALELKGLMLRRLGLIDANAVGGAPQVFQQLQGAAAAQLEAVPIGDTDQRRNLNSIILRAARYRAEMLHSQTAATGNGLGILAEVEEIAADGDHVTGQRLLDRARYFEVSSCIRVALNMAAGLGNGPQTLLRINATIRDYQTLRDDCDPKNWDWPMRVWRACARLFREDGAEELLKEAEAGLVRMQRINQGEGCPLCKPTTGYQDDADRTATPIQ